MAVPRAPRAEQSGIPEAIEQLILTTHEVGAVIWDRYMTALRWNAIGDAMFDFSNYEDPLERNAIVRLNRDKFRAPYYGPDYEQLMRSLVGIFRMAYATAEPTPFARRVYEIAQSYPLFQRFWEDQLIGEALFDTDPGPFERHHEVVGSYSILTSNLRLLRRDDMFLRIFAPADAAAKEKFERLRSLGAPSTRQTRLPE